MAIGAITVLNKMQISGTLNHDLISFAGDGTYPANGSPGFQAAVRAALGKGNVTVMYVVPQDCGGYFPVYDSAGDKLKVFYSDNNNAADGPMIENAAGNLSAITFKLIVVSK
jgi:hypothetical protein